MPRPGLLLRALAALTAITALAPLSAYAAEGSESRGLGIPVSHAAAAPRADSFAPSPSSSAYPSPPPTGYPSTGPGTGLSTSPNTSPSTEATPLALTIDQLTPGTIPRHGKVRISGTVTNDDTATWTDVQIYPFISGTPMTTPAQLAQAVTSDPTVPVGSRILTVSDNVGNLAPGQTVRYSVTIPRSQLVYDDPYSNAPQAINQPGVYWFGVHALGSNQYGRDSTADGRARTFLPLLPQKKGAVPAKVALLLPLRRLVRLAPDGSVADAAGWTADLTTGPLARLVDFASGNLDVTWLVDPAVLDAVRRLAAGNPPRDLSPQTAASTSPNTSPSATPSPSSGASATAPTPTPSPSASSSVDPQIAAARQAAQTWLTQFKQAVANREVLALPYGDPDLSALASHLPSAYATAWAQGNAVFKALGIQTTPVAAPLSGYLSPQALAMVGSKTPVLLGSQAVSGSVGGQVSYNGTQLDLLDTKAAEGGPLPGDPLAPVALRQRLLAEAALRFNKPGDPLVVALPTTWVPPRDSTVFAQPFGADWVDVESFTSAIADMSPTAISAQSLVYPDAERDAQVSAQTLAAVRQLITAGTTLNDVLPDHQTVAAQVAAQALTSTSYSARGGDDGAATLAQQNIEALLARVHIVPPTAVTLSSASGRFSVTVANAMPQPVSVQLRAISDHGIQITGPEALRIAAGDTTAVLLTADAHTNGVHQITLELVDTAGHRVGQAVHFPVRSSEVSGTIWLFVGVGAGLLLIAIVVRLVRRVRTTRRARPAEVS